MKFRYWPNLLIVCCFLLTGVVNSQPVNFLVRMPQSFQGSILNTLELPDGYLVVGNKHVPGEDYIAAVLIRTDKYMNTLWQRLYKVDNADFEFSMAIQANDGGYLVAGCATPPNGRNSPRLLRIDTSGNVLWEKKIGEPVFSHFLTGKILHTPDGYVLSILKANSSSTYQISAIVRLNNAGETIWSRQLDNDSTRLLRAQFIEDNKVWLTGYNRNYAYWGTLNLNDGAVEDFMKYRTDSMTQAQYMERLPGGNLIQTGTHGVFHPEILRMDVWAQKVRPDGKVVWAKQYKVGFWNAVNAGTMLADGSFVMMVSYRPTSSKDYNRSGLIKIDTNGAVVWTRNFGGNIFSIPTELIPTADGGVLALGKEAGPSLVDFFCKTDISGRTDGCCTAELPIQVTDITSVPSPGTGTASDYLSTEPEDMLPYWDIFDKQTCQPFCFNDVPTVFNRQLEFCAGESVVINGISYTQSGTVNDTVPGDDVNCSRINRYVLTQLPQPTLSRTIQFCPGETVTLGSTVYTQPGTVSLVLPATTGCDTLATYTLQLRPQPTVSRTIQFCPGETVTIGGTAYTQPGTVSLVLPATTGGCDTLATYTLQLRPQPTVSRTIQFCPGETVTLGGTAYTQPGTVNLVLPATTGCDTIAHFTLVYESANQQSAVQLTCPKDVVAIAPAGVSAVPVAYDPPVASSDCTCPGTSLALNSGGASGSLFTPGDHSICYRAEDVCGSAKTCCFTIRVESESACDVKTSGCLKFELVSVNRDAARNNIYRIRMTNTCGGEMSYAYIQLPNGIAALAPSGITPYVAPSGQPYTVRNPNFSPFYSLRFKPVGAGLANGQSDVFRYVLPPQAAPEYIHVAARLASGAYVEAHLNTDNCPAGTEPAAPSVNRGSAAATALNVFPNPATEGSTLTIAGGSFSNGIFLLQDLTGRDVQETRIVDNQLSLLPAGLSTGIFYFKILENGVLAGQGKLVLIR